MITDSFCLNKHSFLFQELINMRKKWVALLLIVCITVLSACGSLTPPPLPTQQPEEPVSESEPVPVEPVEEELPEEPEDPEPSAVPEAPTGPQIIVKIENADTQWHFAPDDSGKLILSYLCEKPRVEIEENESASDRINAYLNDLDEEYYTGESHGLGNTLCPGFNKLLEKAYDNYQCSIDYNTELKLDFEFSHYADVVRCDSSVISFIFSDYIDTGSEERAETRYTVSFDTQTGEIIRVPDLAAYPEIRALAEAYIPAGQDTGIDWESSFFSFNRYGLTLLPADTAAEEITIPYSAFSGLDDPLFRPDQRSGSGELGITNSDSEENELPIIDRVALCQEDFTYYLYVKGTVYDFKILSVQYSNFDETFYQQNVYWVSNYISDSRLQMTMDIPDGMPNVMIRYSCDGVQYEQLVTASGYDGRPFLTDRSINAVG